MGLTLWGILQQEHRVRRAVDKVVPPFQHLATFPVNMMRILKYGFPAQAKTQHRLRSLFDAIVSMSEGVSRYCPQRNVLPSPS